MPSYATIKNTHMSLIDGSRLIVEACVRAGADVYVGYPITPANLIYTYSSQRFPFLLPAPDEITALQWIAGLSAAGRLPVTATSFPGFALMLESLNMAFMMELPMLVVLAQRLGPSTGTATAGAQGDLWLLHGMISGGYSLPVLCISNLADCWNLPPVALQVAVDLRTPVVLLTSKEMVMTQASFDLASLEEIHPVKRDDYSGQDASITYAAGAHQTPPFLPVGNDLHQVRLNASTHNPQGLLHHTSPESLANTRRLQEKIETGTPLLYDLDEQAEASTLVMSYGISSGAGREAVTWLREMGSAVSLLVARTMLPIPDIYNTIMDRYSRIVFVEENLQGQYARLLFGHKLPAKVHIVGGIGKMIQPEQIIQAVRRS
jgi:2-oxoglutarate ferredoxin oxidoreductase subunit alpha